MSRITIWMLLAASMLSPTVAMAQRETNFPSHAYYLSFGPYYEGDYERALDAFKSVSRGAVRSTEGKWIDSICYNTMMGECFYRMGDIRNALDQYNAALQLAVFHSNWMLRVEFPETIQPSGRSIRSTITWGSSKRPTQLALVPDRMMTLQGRGDNQNVLQQGGVVATQELYTVNVKEIVRCTALAMRRRRQIMGPMCEHDPFTQQMSAAYSRRPTRPNHWSQSWISCLVGICNVSSGKAQQAVSELNQALLLAGRFDHEVTAIALLELGDLAMEQGNLQMAADMYFEATYTAACFEQFDLMEDGFRGGLTAHLVSGRPGFYRPLGPAASWARTRSRALHASLLLMGAENYAAMGDLANASGTLGQARAAVGSREMRKGAFGAQFNYQSAVVNFQKGNMSGGMQDFSNAMAFQKLSSRRLFQIGLTDAAFSSGSLSQRVADQLYTDVLREPTAKDWQIAPMETLSVVLTPHPAPLEHWFEVALMRKEFDKALEISDRIRRHRFFSTLPMGGRVLALRWILEAPERSLTNTALLQRKDLLAKYPAFAQLSAKVVEIREALDQIPVVSDDPAKSREQTALLEQLAEVSNSQELLLADIALRREASEFAFPPLRTANEIQQNLTKGQLILAFLVTDRFVTAFALTKETTTVAWRLQSPARMQASVSELLEQMGLAERQRLLDAETLNDATWKSSSTKILEHITNNANQNMWDSFDEVIIVPDGMLWYLPFEALQVASGNNSVPLISKVRMRYVPTVSLANGGNRDISPHAETAVVTGKMFLTQDANATLDAYDDIRRAVTATSQVGERLPAPSGFFNVLCDRLVVLNDLEQKSSSVYGWSPMFIDRGKAGASVGDWMRLPWGGADQVVLPGFRSAAEKGARGANGSDMFLSACAMMASGSRSILMSRWLVGGQSTFDLVREYVQELPFTSASAAWQRSVRLERGNMLDVAAEPRLNPAGLGNIRGDHPFFWAGYMLIDTGSEPPAADAAP